MIKFFRHIRRSLIQENKMGKYFKYAIGEILLVVIGILIALQINNWNENKKNHQQELNLLNQLRSDLTENKIEIKDIIKRLNVNSMAMDSLIKRLKKPELEQAISVYTALIHRKSFFTNSNSGYKLLGNGMAKLISNDSLLYSILQLYEKDFPNIKSQENLMNDRIEEKIYPLTNRLFKINPNVTIRIKEFDAVASEIYKPINYKTISSNHEYINSLIQLRKTFKSRLSHLRTTEKKLDEIITMLNKELQTSE